MISITENKINLATKIFFSPQEYRNQFLNAGLLKGKKSNFSGKSFICVSLTRFCPVGCKFCFFKSGPVFKKTSIEDLMTPYGVEKFIEFANAVNLGYLLVSGGGEPMMEKKSVLKIIENVKSERIVLVTSGNWAKNYEGAKRYLNAIIEAIKNRKSETLVTIRVSVDVEHCATVTLNPILNLIQLFYEYSNIIDNKPLELQIHSLDDDNTIEELVKILEQNYTKIEKYRVEEERISDGDNAMKIVPRQEILKIDHLNIKIGYAKIFFSDLRVDLTNNTVISRNINVYQKDLIESEDGNSSIVTNRIGEPGLDFWVNYNGNVTTWGNQYLDNLFNIYIDSPNEIVNKTLNDPAALSFIEKGAVYRDRVVSEVNPISVIRSKVVNIRDYTGALMFDEARTRLYYTIRVLQDYIKEGKISKDKVQSQPSNLQEILKINQAQLIQAYKESEYTIVEQTIEKKSNKEHLLDILKWIKLGHYNLTDDKKNKLLDFYNKNTNSDIGFADLEVIQHNIKMQIVRMTEHLTHIKYEALIDEEKVV